MNASQTWYYSINNQQHGPVPRAQLDQILSGHSPADVLVWSEGMSDWMPASKLGQAATPVMPYSTPSAPSYQAPQLLHARRTNGLAIASLVLGILAVLTMGIIMIPQILAVVFGHISLSQCKKDPNIDGRGMAIAGLIMGYIFTGLWLFFFLIGFIGALSA